MQLRSVCVALLLTACGGDDGGGSGQPDAGVADGPRPSKRSDVGGVVTPSGQLIVFGGDDGPIIDQRPMPAYRGDTWVLADGSWEEIAGAGPSARGRHAVAYDPSGGRMLLFGGRFREAGTSGDYTLFGDLWAYDVAAGAWSELASGGGPGPRYFAAAAYDPSAGVFYVYGGGTNTDPLALQAATDLWAYDGSSWSQVVTSGDAPSLRLFVAYTYDSRRNRLVVYGGQVGDFISPALADLHAVDLATGAWTQLHDGSADAPSGRFSAALTYDPDGDRYLLFGGHADPGVENDVWAFDPGANTWSELRDGDGFTGAALGCLDNPREIPNDYVDQDPTAPERRSTPVFGWSDGGALLFAGESDCSDHLDDVWRLGGDGSWQELLSARSGESCLRRGDDCTCLCL